ncbi:MAG: hypothetical protein JWN01_1294 [Patescibacteria group bacterium]|nr:hypothetical protein [Patescibacteria group bacterium]
MDELHQKARQYRINVYKRDGSIGINHDQTQNQIIVGSQLSSFSTNQLQEISYVLSHVAKNPGMNAIIENDHFEFWAFINQLIRTRRSDFWVKEHNPFFILINADIATRSQPRYNDQESCQHRNDLLSSLSYHPFFPAVWAGFAYLEGLCRRLCGEYVATDGKIKKAFRVNGQQYRTQVGHRRASGKYKGKTSISSLKDMLTLTRRVVSRDGQRILTKFFKDYSASTLFNWRNECLHGSEDRITVIIAQYCLISMLLLECP